MIREHHQRVVDKLVEKFTADEKCLAVIIGGSIAKGTAADNSDVDILVVVTDDEFRRRLETDDIFYLDQDMPDYEGGYVDGKFIDLQFVYDADEKGSEPARWAFTGAFTAFSRVPGLDEVVRRIPTYQDGQQHDKLRSFYSQIATIPWFMREAERRQDSYLLTQSAADMALFAGRLILAHNRMLFPGHKWMMHEVKKAPDKPQNALELIDSLLAEPSRANASALFDCMKEYYGDFGQDWMLAVAQFVKDCEWNWRDRIPPLQDC